MVMTMCITLRSEYHIFTGKGKKSTELTKEIRFKEFLEKVKSVKGEQQENESEV
jgi:hypothetical protein